MSGSSIGIRLIFRLISNLEWRRLSRICLGLRGSALRLLRRINECLAWRGLDCNSGRSKMIESSSSSIVISESSWQAEWPRLPSLLQRHGHELGETHMVLDLGSIAELDSKGALLISTAHDSDRELDQELIAYCIWYLGPDLSRQGSNCAQMGPFYVEPSYRKSGPGRDLLESSLESLRKRRVWKAFPHFYEHSPDLSGMFESLGGVPYERVWQIDLRKRTA